MQRQAARAGNYKVCLRLFYICVLSVVCSGVKAGAYIKANKLGEKFVGFDVRQRE